MAKLVRGRAGREDRKSDQRDTYGSDLALLLAKNVRPQPTAHLLHLGAPGLIPLVSDLAPRMQAGKITALVYSYDELAAAQAALAPYPNVQIINEWDELPLDTTYNLATSIIPYYLGDDYIQQIFVTAFEQLKSSGLLVVGTDRRHDGEHYITLLSSIASPVTTLATSAHLRIVQVEASAYRRRGNVIRRT